MITRSRARQSLRLSLIALALCLPGTINSQSVLPVANGGTGGTTAATARSNLGVASTSVGDSDLTGLTASQSTVTLVASTASAGKFRINYYADQNAVCTTGSYSVFFSFQWTDASHSRTTNSVTLTLMSSQSANQGSIQGVVPIYAGVGTAITYTSTVTGSCSSGGPSSYDVHISVESVQ